MLYLSILNKCAPCTVTGLQVEAVTSGLCDEAMTIAAGKNDDGAIQVAVRRFGKVIRESEIWTICEGFSIGATLFSVGAQLVFFASTSV
jgi:hypothetical protein